MIRVMPLRRITNQTILGNGRMNMPLVSDLVNHTKAPHLFSRIEQRQPLPKLEWHAFGQPRPQQTGNGGDVALGFTAHGAALGQRRSGCLQRGVMG